jgi:hypothetical protein
MGLQRRGEEDLALLSSPIEALELPQGTEVTRAALLAPHSQCSPVPEVLASQYKCGSKRRQSRCAERQPHSTPVPRPTAGVEQPRAFRGPPPVPKPLRLIKSAAPYCELCVLPHTS